MCSSKLRVSSIEIMLTWIGPPCDNGVDHFKALFCAWWHKYHRLWTRFHILTYCSSLLIRSSNGVSFTVIEEEDDTKVWTCPNSVDYRRGRKGRKRGREKPVRINTHCISASDWTTHPHTPLLSQVHKPHRDLTSRVLPPTDHLPIQTLNNLLCDSNLQNVKLC